MDSHAAPSASVDDQDEVLASAPGMGDLSPPESGRLRRDSADDELLDEFWRRRSSIGHC